MPMALECVSPQITSRAIEFWIAAHALILLASLAIVDMAAAGIARGLFGGHPAQRHLLPLL